MDGWPTDRLAALGKAIGALPPDRHWAYDSVLDRVLRLLALTPEPGRAEAAVRVAPAAQARVLAALLASAQPEKVLVSLLAGDLETELGACLLHEMVLRRKSVVAVADAWQRRLAGHPLAGLPLYPLPGETRLPLPRFSLAGRSYGRPAGPGRADPLVLPGAVPAVTRERAPADLTAAVTTWLTRSNGRAEAAVVRCRPPLTPADVGVRTLGALGLDCLAGNGLALRRAGLADVVAMLFGAAAGGGAYDSGLGGAYGRAATWRSVTALAGGSHVGRTWWTFDAANDWFHRIAWDVGVVCLRPGGHVMAVLAATDTD